MCGRYALFGPISRHRKNRPIDELPEWYPGLVDAINARPMRFNVAPTDVMPIVGTSREGAITLKELRWGLVPYWAKDVKIGYKAINARVETVADKPMFREAFKRRRCLVPASGYFEWKPECAAKQPYVIHDYGGELLMFAGFWEPWREAKESDPSRQVDGYTFPMRATLLVVFSVPAMVYGSLAAYEPADALQTDAQIAERLCGAFMQHPRLSEKLKNCFSHIEGGDLEIYGRGVTEQDLADLCTSMRGAPAPGGNIAMTAHNDDGSTLKLRCSANGSLIRRVPIDDSDAPR